MLQANNRHNFNAMQQLIFVSFLVSIACHTWIKLITQPSFLDRLKNYILLNINNQTLLTWAGLGCEYCFTLFWSVLFGVAHSFYWHYSLWHGIAIALLSAFFSYPLTYLKNNS